MLLVGGRADSLLPEEKLTGSALFRSACHYRRWQGIDFDSYQKLNAKMLGEVFFARDIRGIDFLGKCWSSLL